MKKLLISLLFFLAFNLSAQRRTGIQDYSTVATLQAETLTPQQNDKVFLKDLNAVFTWNSASTATHDGIKVIKQTNIAMGRFLLVGVAQPDVEARLPFHSISQLRAFTSTEVTAKARVFVTDTTRQGVFYLDPTDTTTPDNGGTVIVTSNNKRYKRDFENYVNAKWFGAVGDGTTNDTNALIAAFNTKKNVYVPLGTYLVNSTMEIYNNVLCEKGAVFKVANSTSDTIFIVKSKKGLSIKGIYINAQGSADNPLNGINPSISVIGLRIEGLWNSSIDDFSMLSHELSTGNIGIDIMTSQLYNLKHGSFDVTINRPYLIRGGIGIRTKQTAGDEIGETVELTHITINDGWVGSQFTYNLHLQNIVNLCINNLATDVIRTGVVGYKIVNCNQATILVGEYNAGNGVLANITGGSFIRFLSPRLLTVGTDITGSTNNVSLYTANTIRISPTTDPGYYAEIRSDYTAEPFVITGNFGDATIRNILQYNISNGLRTQNKKILTEDNTVTITGKTISGSSNTITNINNSNWSGTALSIANGGTGSSSGVGLLSGLTSGYIPRATASNTVGIGSIQDNGSQIGIGTNPNASYRMLVSGASYLNGATTLGYDVSNVSLYLTAGTAFRIGGSNNFYFDFATGGTTGDFIFRGGQYFEDRLRLKNQGGIVLPKYASDPTGQEGEIYFNTTSKVVRVHNGTSWANL